MATMELSHRAEPQFSQPVRQIVTMLIVLGLTVAIAVMLFPKIGSIFLASPYLKIFIVFVFFIGVAACFWQVITLISSVNWIEGFALDRPGHEFTQAPRLLAPLAVDARQPPGAAVADLVLDALDPRDGGDAHRGAARPHPLHHQPADLPRPARHLLRPRHRRPRRRRHHPLARPEGGAERDAGLRRPDGRASRASSAAWAPPSARRSSASPGSLVVGLLELFASHAQNRFYRELEEWLSSITKLGIAGVEPEEALTAANVLTVIGHTTEQIDALRAVVEQGTARAVETDAKLAAPGRDPRRAEARGAPAVDNALLERIAAAQERVAPSDREPRRRGGRPRRRDAGAAALDRHPGAAHPRRPRRRPAGSRHRDPPGHRRPRRRAAGGGGARKDVSDGDPPRVEPLLGHHLAGVRRRDDGPAPRAVLRAVDLHDRPVRAPRHHHRAGATARGALGAGREPRRRPRARAQPGRPRGGARHHPDRRRRRRPRRGSPPSRSRSRA